MTEEYSAQEGNPFVSGPLKVMASSICWSRAASCSPRAAVSMPQTLETCMNFGKLRLRAGCKEVFSGRFSSRVPNLAVLLCLGLRVFQATLKARLEVDLPILLLEKPIGAEDKATGSKQGHQELSSLDLGM